MKLKLALLILCWPVLMAAIPTLVIVGFVKLDFHWLNAACFLAVGAGVYAGILWIGEALNDRFSAVVQGFISGQERQLQPGRQVQRLFGVLLVTLLPFLLYLLLLALFLAITFVEYGSRLITRAGRLQIAVAIGLGIIGIGTIIAFCVALRHLFFPPKDEPSGIGIAKSEQPDLWQFVKTVADRFGTKPIDRIILTADPGISVFLSGPPMLAMMGRGVRIMLIGVPSMHELKLSEFSAILAHEYGHIFNRDTQWGAFTYVMGRSLLSALEATPGPSDGNTSNGFRSVTSFVVSANPAYWLLKSFVYLFFKVTSSFSRLCEVMADVSAMTVYGGPTLKSGLLRVASNDTLFFGLVDSVVIPAWLNEGKALSSLFAAMDLAKSQTEENGQIVGSEDLPTEEEGPYDTHPPLRTRLRYSERFPDVALESNGNLVDLFRGWRDLEQEATDMFNGSVAHALRTAMEEATPGEQE